MFPKYDVKTLTKILGFSFNKIENSNEYFDVLTGDGFGPIRHAELRIDKDKKNLHKALLILKIFPLSNISQKIIMEKYPEARPQMNDPIDPIPYSLIVNKPWGKISFGFGPNDILSYIVFDSISSGATLLPLTPIKSPLKR
ncbi:MAG: hypothetical protein AAB453_02990 [Patescibacteria group bacterium]